MSLQIQYVFLIFFTVCMCLDNLGVHEWSLDYLQLFFGFFVLCHVGEVYPKIKV
jgi:hypothetical protein